MSKIELKDNQYWSLAKGAYSDYSVGSVIRDISGKRWRVILKENTKNGYQGYAVVPANDFIEDKTGNIFSGKNQKYDNVVILSRGTEPTKFDHDLVTDAQYVVMGKDKNKKPNQFKDAEHFYQVVQKRFSPQNTYVTGHSLGGAISLDLAAEYQAKGVTFAAPNIYQILSPEAKKRVDNGSTENLIIDYTHEGEQIGLWSQYGAPFIGKQFRTTGKGHGIETFIPYFSATGSAELLIQPEAIQQEATKLKNIAVNFDTVVEAIQEMERTQEEEIRRIISDARAMISSGELGLLDEYDIEEELREMATQKHGGQYYFYDVALSEELQQKMKDKQKSWLEFGDAIGYAGYKFQERDAELGDMLGGPLDDYSPYPKKE
ncbi:DUF6792 domain-containing protein [Listeria fleischmannii]|uniref:DUF6792 domain-containing protein n=1 Tax=Listeria fleischmannii TaxID=1069827 RepID=A0A841YIL1_9LIST|nr:DUF6792 domain-containing protein [Listeria fleischmannii]MBC1399934.1 hypothetical protein [Listeria fleischmannii]